MTDTNKKRRPNGYSDAELKAYDGLSKTELFEVLGKVMRGGYTPPADLDLAKEIKRINKEINPDSGSTSAPPSPYLVKNPVIASAA